MATFGSIPAIFFALSAEAMAIAASCSAVGSGLTAQSPNTITPFSPYLLFSGKIIIKQLLTVEMPGAVLII